MEYNAEKKEIILNRNISNLDKFALDFTQILEKYTDYVIISGYVAILLGRGRATEDIDIFIKPISKEAFSNFHKELRDNNFWCLNAEDDNEIYAYLKDGLAVRFSRKNNPMPNFEVKFPKREVDQETFNDFITVKLPKGSLKISSLERQIAFKRYYLESEKDVEDALHIEEIFRAKLDYEKINKLKEIIDKIKEEEENAGK